MDILHHPINIEFHISVKSCVDIIKILLVCFKGLFHW